MFRTVRVAVALSAVLFSCLPAFAQLGKIKVRSPGTFVHATVPLEPAMLLTDRASRFALRAPDGTQVIAQATNAVRAPDGRTRVVELDCVTSSAAVYDLVDLGAEVLDPIAQPIGFARDLAANPPVITVDGVALHVTYRAGQDFRRGRACITRYFAGPHAFGWITLINGSRVALVDLVLHDGTPGANVWTFSNVAIGPGLVVSALPEPTISGNTLLSCGWMKQRQRREFRIALVENAADKAEALALLGGGGFGVSDRWGAVDAFGPQQMRIADLSWLTGQDSRLRSDYKHESDAVLNGWTHGVGAIYGQPGGQVGDYSPYGAGYGAITGGTEIFQRDETGMLLALSGEPQGLLLCLLRHRTYTDRHPVGLYGGNGKPIDPWPLGWRPDIVDGDTWAAHTTDPFPHASQTTPIQSWAPIDYQHGIRRWRDCINLCWLDNDPLARRELELNTLLWVAALRMHLPTVISQATAVPGHGCEWGRAQGWSNELLAATYATGDAALRASLLPFLQQITEAYRLVQMPSGIWQAGTNSKTTRDPPYNNLWAVEQTIEEGIGANGLVCLRGSCGMDVDAQIVRAAREGVWRYLWVGGPDGGGTWQFAAVRATPYGSDPCTSIPAGMHGTKQDTSQVGATLGYALAIAPGDLELRAAVHAYTQGAADPIAWIKSKGFADLTNREPLLAALQRWPHAP